MILIHVISRNEEQASEIANFLVSKNLIISACILEKTEVRKKSKNDTLISSTQFLIMGKTKALLFNKIDKLLRKKYKERMPELYSLAIVNMDWDKANELVEQTEKI